MFNQYLYFLLTKGTINEIAETHFLTPPCCLSNLLSSKNWSLYSNFINITSKITSLKHLLNQTHLRLTFVRLLILWRELSFYVFMTERFQESFEKMRQIMVEIKSKLTTAISPMPISYIFMGKKWCLILLHPSFSHGIINGFEECQPCLNSEPMQGTCRPAVTHQDILNSNTALSMCPSPHKLFTVFGIWNFKTLLK